MRRSMDSRERICLDCGELKPFDAFTPIRGTSKVYGRCKACRARRARENKTGTAQMGSAASLVGARPAARVKTASALRSRESSRRSRPLTQVVTANERTCTECGQTKPLSGFLPIKATRHGYYGRCRDCRNARARARNSSHQVLRAQPAASANASERTGKECGETKPLSGFL
jgi:hypothetical protein